MSLYNTDVQGNANISRNVNVGGHAKVNGDVTVNHNLFVKGWIDAPNIKGPLKGLYASEETLKAAYPRPMPGWFALVGNTLPAQVWRVDGGKWMPTGETGGTFNLWLDNLEADVKDLTDDVRDLEDLLADGLLLGESIAFSSTGAAASMTFTVLKRDGSTKTVSKPIPIVTAEKAGMMTAADKTELSAATTAITAINRKISELEAATATLRQALEKETADRQLADRDLRDALDEETTAREGADENLQDRINTEQEERLKLQARFEALVGDNASEAIDNFTEILAFLDGLKDTDRLSTKLTDLSGADKKLGEDVLELQKKVFPLLVEFDATPTVIKAGQPATVHLTWSAERRRKDVTAEAEIKLDNAAATGKAADRELTLAHGASRQFVLSVEFEGLTETLIRSVKGTHPTYFGSVARTWEGSEAAIKALGELTIGNRALTRTGIAVTDGRIALAYPKDFGPLTSVRDGNGYEVLTSYTRSELSVHDTAYYLYLLTVPVTASGVTQIYK